MRTIRRPVLVYDPDTVNPYGRELSAILSELSSVTYIGPHASSWAPSTSHLAIRRVLGSSPKTDGIVAYALLRVLAPVVVAVTAIVRRRVLVVVWTSGRYDAATFALCSWLVPALIVVNHNPSAIRAAGSRMSRLAYRILMRRATVAVVHAPALLSAAKLESDALAVAPHPPYTAWSEAFFSRVRHPTATVAFVGATRRDKGAPDFVAAVTRMRTRPLRAMFLGKGALSDGDQRALEVAGVDVVAPSRGFLSDPEFGALLGQTDIVLAPYTQVTQSGSALMALTCGIPVVAYAGGGLIDHLPSEWLIAPGDIDAMAHVADELLSNNDDLARLDIHHLADRTRAAWADILSSVGALR